MTNNNIRRRSTLERFRRCLLRHEGALHSRCHVRCPLDSTRRGRVGVIRYDHIHYTRVKRKEKKKKHLRLCRPVPPQPKAAREAASSSSLSTSRATPQDERKKRFRPHPPGTRASRAASTSARAPRHATPTQTASLAFPPPIEPPSPSASRLRARLGGGREARSWAGVSAPQGPGRRDREKGPRLLAPRALDWVSWLFWSFFFFGGDFPLFVLLNIFPRGWIHSLCGGWIGGAG